MKRSLLTLSVSVLIAAFAYWIGYRTHTATLTAQGQSDSPELNWLKTEFHLTQSDFDRIARLHAEYKPHCKEMCRRIDQHNKQVEQVLLSTNQMTAEVESLFSVGAQLRADCQREMLRHFYRVSQQMPPQQGRRYLEWVCRQTSVADSAMQRPE